MVKFWVNRIRTGKSIIDDVPKMWREAVLLEVNIGQLKL